MGIQFDLKATVYAYLSQFQDGCFNLDYNLDNATYGLRIHSFLGFLSDNKNKLL